MTAKPAIFISYRRSDVGHAGRLYDRLRHWFAQNHVFYDLDGIDMGDVFPERIEAALGDAAVVLVLIGPDWLTEINHRVAQPGVDFVRREVELALARRAAGTLVLPVLLGGAAMPAAPQFDAALQARLAPLSDLNAHAFQAKQADWDNQFVALRDRIAAASGLAPRFRPPPGTDLPWRIIGHDLSAHFQDPNSLLPKLHAQLDAGGSAALVARAALHGMGGLGKTQLALKYSLDYRDRYAGVWWFRAETETTLQLDAQDACAAVDAPAIPGQTPAAGFRAWLERQDAPWLLVYDNAENVAALRPCLPRRGPHRVIVTSRNPDWNGIASTLELEVWSPAQGAAFFAARLPGRADAELQALSRDLGGLPLALEQAAGYIETTAIAIADYRALLTAVDTEGAILDEGRAATGYERSVLVTLTLALEKLSEPARQVLRLLAFAAPEPLPEGFLRKGAKALSEELAGLVANPMAWNKLIAELRAYGLAERSDIAALDRPSGAGGTATEPALSLHRLTQQALRARLAQPKEDCLRFESMLRLCCPDETQLPQHWAQLAALTPHVTHLERYLVTDWLERRAYSGLLDRVATYLQSGPALYAASVQWFRLALEIDRADLGEEHPDTLICMGNLAGTLLAQGDLVDARELQESVLATHRRVLGEEQPDTLTSMNNLAGALWAQGDLAGARELLESVLATRRRVLGEEHTDTLSSMNNLAETRRAQGDLADARALQDSALVVLRRVLGGEHPGTLTAMNNLALTLEAQGDLAGARELQESVLETRRRVLGEEHPDTLSSMNNLAETLRAQGVLGGALELEKSVLATRRRVLGEDHPATLMAMNNLASTLQAQGDFTGACLLHESALAARRSLLGEEHPDTLQSMNNLASTLQAQGNLAAAFELEKSALATTRRLLGEEHPNTLTAMNNLATTLRTQGDLAGASELEKSALATRRRVLGEEHPATLTAMNNLASTLQDQGNPTGARLLHESALAARRSLLGEEHPDTLQSMNNLASTLEAQGNLAGALELEKSVLATRCRVLGEEHPDTLASMNNLAGTLWQLEQYLPALQQMRVAAAGLARVLGPDHPTTTAARSAADAMEQAIDQAGENGTSP